jgi:tyrosine aminotransferase
MSSWEVVSTTALAERTTNPIRAIVDTIKPDPKHPKKMLALSIGDPTVDGNILPPQGLLDTMCATVKNCKHTGYGPAVGFPDARAAVAEYWVQNFAPASAFTADDVCLTSGASHALELAICALCNEGDSLLLPKPCFPLYGTLTANRGITANYYTCEAGKNWEADLDSIRAAVDSKTKAILLCNPSNPCGSNFSPEHVKALVALCDELKLPIISDEIYAGMVFPTPEQPEPVFTSVAAVSTQVPCLVVGGIAKNFLVPGYRMGWVMRHDPAKLFGKVYGGVCALASLLVGPNAIVQGSLRALLHETPATYGIELRATLSHNADVCFDALKGCAALTAVKPQGAMYMMIGINFDKIDGIADDLEFAQKLMVEQNVMVLPGAIFGAPGFMRIVFTKPDDQLAEAVERMAEFAGKYAKK